MMLTRHELVLQFMLALSSNENFKPTKDDSDKIFAMACILADKYLESM